jgi:hypothetical protein
VTQPLTTLPLVEQFAYGLDAPICLTWELTYACNLSCVHCLSSSGRRDPRELSTAECRAVIDELPLDGPGPECVKGHGERALTAIAGDAVPRPFGDHSHRTRPVPVSIGPRPVGRSPDRACDENPLAGSRPGPPGGSRPPTQRVRAT